MIAEQGLGIGKVLKAAVIMNTPLLPRPRFLDQRECKECGTKLSTYNPGPCCYAHEEPRFSMKVRSTNPEAIAQRYIRATRKMSHQESRLSVPVGEGGESSTGTLVGPNPEEAS